MSQEPQCRTCACYFELSNRRLWKALCLDCADEAKWASIDSRESKIGQLNTTVQELQHEVECLRDRVQCLEDENSSLKSFGYSHSSSFDSSSCNDPACCRDCHVELERSNAGLWKAFCLDCTNSFKAQLGSYRVQVQRLQDENQRLRETYGEVESLQAQIRDLNDEMASKDAARRQEITNLHNASSRKSDRIADLEDQVEARRNEVAGLNCAIRSRNRELALLEEDVRDLEGQLQVENGRADGMSFLLGCATERARQAEDAHHATLAVKNDLQRQVAELTRQQEKHRKTCPAHENEIMFQASEFTDVCVSAGVDTFSVHRAVLASRSPVFATMLSVPMRESNERLIEITDMSARALEEFLHFMYTGNFQETFKAEEIGAEVLAAAHKYDVPGLQAELTEVLGATAAPGGNILDRFEQLSLSVGGHR